MNGLAVLAILALISVVQSDDALAQFNRWMETGTASASSTATARIVRLDEGETSSPLRLELQHTQASLDTFPVVSLPLHSHVLGDVFMKARPYYASLLDVPGTGIEKQLQMLTVTLMTEIALWDASPIRPWCHFLLKEPKSIGLSTPPILWPRELAEELEPKSLLVGLKSRQKTLEGFVSSTQGKKVLNALDTFVNKSLSSLGEARGTFSMLSGRNYLRVRAIIEACTVWSAPGGLLCVPFGNFLETKSSVDENVKDRYLQQNMNEPMIRRLRSVATAGGDAWSFHPTSREVRLVEDTDRHSLPVVEIETSNVFAVEEYFATFGRLPTRVPWSNVDCQLVVFSNGLSRERNKMKGSIAVMLDDFLHHFSCIRQNAVPSHGLVAALISVLPSSTPKSFEDCVHNAVKRYPPIEDALMEMLYRTMIVCLTSATWKDPSEMQAVLDGHKLALHRSIATFFAEQFRSSKTLAADEKELGQLSEQVRSGRGSVVERHAAVNLRYHRKVIMHQLLERIGRDEIFDDLEDKVEL